MFMNTIIGTPILDVNRYSDLMPNDNIGMSIGSRIKEARRAAKLTQKALAQKVGMAQASLSELETGESQGTTMIGSFAAVLGVSALWLETGKGAMVTGQPTLQLVEPDSPFIEAPAAEPGGAVRAGEGPNTVAIQRIKLRLRAGVANYDTEPDMDGDGHVHISQELLDQLRLDPANLRVLRVRGPSMEPMMFEDDAVVVDLSDRKPRHKEVYAINWNGEPVIKQLIQRGKEWYLHSINQDFGPVNVRSGQCSIVARVVIQPTRVLTGRL